MKWYFFPFYFISDLWLILRNRALYHFYRVPPKSWKTGARGDVVLIQGLNARWVSLKKIGKAIHKQGYRIHIVEKLENNTKPVIQGSADISHYIESNNLKNVILVGHSKGAINAICLLKNPDIAQRIKMIINIAGPLKGTLLTRFYLTGRELEPGSDLIKHYNEGINSKKIVNLFPLIDDMVIPNKSLRGDHEINKPINVFGHIRIVESRQTIREIKSLLNS